VSNRKLRFRLIRRENSEKKPYYTTTVDLPAMVDLSNCVIHFFPDHSGGELTIQRRSDDSNNSNT
jgi:hypothetical protein